MPKGSRVEKCVKDVKKKHEKGVNPYAVCSAATGQKYADGKPISKEAKERHKRAMAHKENTTMKYASQLFIEGYLVEGGGSALSDEDFDRPIPSDAGVTNGKPGPNYSKPDPQVRNQSINTAGGSALSDKDFDGPNAPANPAPTNPSAPSTQPRTAAPAVTNGKPGPNYYKPDPEVKIQSIDTGPTAQERATNKLQTGGNSAMMQNLGQQMANQAKQMPVQQTTGTPGNGTTQRGGYVPGQIPQQQQPAVAQPQSNNSYQNDPDYQQFLQWKRSQGK